ncbi:hypothetical protein Bca101_044866 [Brassica carinata]
MNWDRSLISSDEEGDDLYRGLGDKEDTSVDTLVALIDDDYPFEHNTWSGGVKADEIRVKKGNAQTSESSDENVPEPVEKDNVHHGVVESGGYPGDPKADAYEEKVIAMFEGYILSLKGHFNSEVGGLRTELQSATSAIGQLESKVTGEFEKINQILKSRFGVDDMGPTYGFSPQSQFPGQDDDFNNAEVNPDRSTTYTGATDGVGAHTEADGPRRLVWMRTWMKEKGGGGGLSPGKQTDSTDGVEFTSETGGEDKGADHSGHDPVNVEGRLHVVARNKKEPPILHLELMWTSECIIECPIDDPMSGLVNKILSDAGVDKEPLRSSTCSGTVNLGSSNVPQTSSDAIPEKVGIDGKKGDDVDEDDVTITKVQAGRVNTDAAVVQADGGRRFSTRTHTSPKRYTPPAPIVRKKEGNRKVPRRMDDNVPPLACEKASVESSIPKPPTQEKATFIGGFSAFTPPTPAARETFLKKMAEAKSNAPSLGSVISIASLDDMFNCTGVCSYEAVDRVVGWIRKRRDSNLSSKFDFILPNFFMELLADYPAFDAMQDKDAFTFPMSLRSQFMHRHDGLRNGFADVGYLCGGREPDMSYYFVIKDVLKPISIMMPHMISRLLSNQRPRELNFLPFPISRLDIPVLLEHPGYSAVVALILLEISAVGGGYD